MEKALLANLRGEAKKFGPPESGEPPSNDSRPMPQPVSPPAALPHLVPPVSPTGTAEVPPPPPLPIRPAPDEAPITEIRKVTVSEKESVRTVEAKDLGRGGARHKSIQKRLETEARKLGFHAEIEKQLAKGSNDAADLVLRRGHIEIAVEISITTGADYEFENIKKCLASGFGRVAMVATGRKQLENITAGVRAGLDPEAGVKVSYHTPDEFLAELQKLAKTAEEPPASEPMAKTSKMLGFEITRNFPKQSPEEQRLNQQAINEVTLRALKS